MEIIIIIVSLITASLISILAKRRGIIEFFSVIASLVALFESCIVISKVLSQGVYSPFILFSVDSLGAIVLLIICIVYFASIVYSIQYLRQETAKNIIGLTRARQYFALLNIFLLAMILAIVANNPIFAWITIEATTLSTAFLISFYNKPSAMEAAWKYLIINSTGLLLGFFGTLLYFTALQGEPIFATWDILFSNALLLDPIIAKIAFIFVLIGYGTKVGFAPMHTWLPDAHSKAPAPVSALLSGVLLNVAFITILRFKFITDAAVGVEFAQKLLIIFGLLSIIIASFIIFTQKNYKRLLAYSSIENMGIVALGFGFGGLGVLAAILHMIYHAFAKSALFLSAGNIFLKYGSTKIINIKGVLKTIPATGVLFLIGFFAIIGMPPFGIFLTKLFIFSAGIASHPIITITVIILMAILFIGFLKHISVMFFGEKPADMIKEKENIWLVAPPTVLLALILFLSFYQPHFLQELINNVILKYEF